eukprot:4508345-Pyramimonas_sp.AAC.1
MTAWQRLSVHRRHASLTRRTDDSKRPRKKVDIYLPGPVSGGWVGRRSYPSLAAQALGPAAAIRNLGVVCEHQPVSDGLRIN